MSRRPIDRLFWIMIGALIPGVVSWSATDPALIGWWTFDEGSGDVIADSSPNHNNGHFYQGEPNWVAGIHGCAGVYQGSGGGDLYP